MAIDFPASPSGPPTSYHLGKSTWMYKGGCWRRRAAWQRIWKDYQHTTANYQWTYAYYIPDHYMQVNWKLHGFSPAAAADNNSVWYHLQSGDGAASWGVLYTALIYGTASANYIGATNIQGSGAGIQISATIPGPTGLLGIIDISVQLGGAGHYNGCVTQMGHYDSGCAILSAGGYSNFTNPLNSLLIHTNVGKNSTIANAELLGLL